MGIGTTEKYDWSELRIGQIASPKSWPRDHAKLHSDKTHSLASATVYQTISQILQINYF